MTTEEEGWAYWSLAVDMNSPWYPDLQEAAKRCGLTPAIGLSTPGGGPNGCGAEPYLRIDNGSIQRFDQRRRQWTKSNVVLAGKTFEAQTVHYRFRQPKAERVQREVVDGDDLISRLKGARALSRTRATSPLKSWQRVRELWVEASLADYASELSFSDVKELCERTGIVVVEMPMRECGRIVVEPVWVETPKCVGWGDFRVSIAVRSDLSEAQRRIALIHEVGHYVHHFTGLLAMLRLQYEIARAPALERTIGTTFARPWREHRSRVMEWQADTFSSFFVVSDRVLRGLVDPRSGIDSSVVKGSLLTTLRRVFDRRWSPPRNYAAEAARHWQQLSLEGYPADATWLDRLAYCLVTRSSPALGTLVLESAKLEEEMDGLLATLQDRPTQGGAPVAPEHQILARIAEPEVEQTFGSPDQWDPMIVEPRGGTQPTGYLPLRPMFTRQDRIDTYDWVRADGQGDEQVGQLCDWWSLAEADGKGLILFPMSPINHALRARYA